MIEPAKFRPTNEESLEARLDMMHGRILAASEMAFSVHQQIKHLRSEVQQARQEIARLAGKVNE